MSALEESGQWYRVKTRSERKRLLQRELREAVEASTGLLSDADRLWPAECRRRSMTGPTEGGGLGPLRASNDLGCRRFWQEGPVEQREL